MPTKDFFRFFVGLYFTAVVSPKQSLPKPHGKKIYCIKFLPIKKNLRWQGWEFGEGGGGGMRSAKIACPAIGSAEVF